MPTRTCLVGCAILANVVSCVAQDFHPDIPKAWNDKEVESFEVPLAQRDRTPRHMTAEEYYKLKVRPIYRSYPAYAKGQEPAGYRESLKEKDPEIVFDAFKLDTREDWIAAGKLVFESDILFRPAPAAQPSGSDTPWPVSSEGILPSFVPGFRYYVRRKGVLERGINACANCHTHAGRVFSRRSPGSSQSVSLRSETARITRRDSGRASAAAGRRLGQLRRAMGNEQRGL